MSFDFAAAFDDALKAGLGAARPGGKAAEEWVRDTALANKAALEAIAEGVAKGEISRETAEGLLNDRKKVIEAQVAALDAIVTATAQAGVNAFLRSLTGALQTVFKLAI